MILEVAKHELKRKASWNESSEQERGNHTQSGKYTNSINLSDSDYCLLKITKQ